MKTKLQSVIHVGEGCLGYTGVSYVPKNIALKRYNGLVASASLLVAGHLVPVKVGGAHVVAVGVGAMIGSILDFVGLKR